MLEILLGHKLFIHSAFIWIMTDPFLTWNLIFNTKTSFDTLNWCLLWFSYLSHFPVALRFHFNMVPFNTRSEQWKFRSNQSEGFIRERDPRIPARSQHSDVSATKVQACLDTLVLCCALCMTWNTRVYCICNLQFGLGMCLCAQHYMFWMWIS